jgi:hypothetical protein
LGIKAQSTGAPTLQAVQRRSVRRESCGRKLTKRAQYSLFQKMAPSGEHLTRVKVLR